MHEVQVSSNGALQKSCAITIADFEHFVIGDMKCIADRVWPCKDSLVESDANCLGSLHKFVDRLSDARPMLMKQRAEFLISRRRGLKNNKVRKGFLSDQIDETLLLTMVESARLLQAPHPGMNSAFDDFVRQN